jgi:hypothetical protein
MKPWNPIAQPRRSLVLIALVGLSLGCVRRAAPAAATAPGTMQFLSLYGSFSPAEAKEIARQMQRGPRDLAVQLAAARREGILLRLGDLQPALPTPIRNAAPIYIQLMSLLKEKPLDPSTDKVRGSLGSRVVHSPEEVAAARRLLSERKDVMQLVHEAASKPECVFRRDWTRGMLIEYPENVAMREAARMLSAESFFLAKAGRYREAVENQALIFRVAQHPTSDPAAICQLAGISCDAIALAGMENILCTAGTTHGVAVAVRTAVSTGRPHFDLRRTLAGEIATYSVSLNGLRRGSPLTDDAHRLLWKLYGSGRTADPPDVLQKYPQYGNPLANQLLDANQAYYLSEMRPLIAACEKPYALDRPLLQHLDTLSARESRNPGRQLAAPGLILGGLLTLTVHARAAEETIMAGATILAYKGQQGRFPESLAELGTTTFPDPFGSGVLKYRREVEGFVVYSVGPDGNFDGSQPGAPIDRHQAFFRFPSGPQLPPRN